jgi:hypothetical protein
MAIGHDHNDPARDRNHDGRVDSADRATHERVTHERVVHAPDPTLTKEVRRDAYERGRADERSRHKRNPLLTFLIVLAAAIGLVVTFLAVREGGFSGAGQVIDREAQEAAELAKRQGAEVADEAGEGLQDAGRRVEREGEAAQRPAREQAPAQR